MLTVVWSFLLRYVVAVFRWYYPPKNWFVLLCVTKGVALTYTIGRTTLPYGHPLGSYCMLLYIEGPLRGHKQFLTMTRVTPQFPVLGSGFWSRPQKLSLFCFSWHETLLSSSFSLTQPYFKVSHPWGWHDLEVLEEWGGTCCNFSMNFSRHEALSTLYKPCCSLAC